MTAQQRHNLELSRSMVAGKQPRPIRCPCCNMRILDVFDYGSYVVSVKCPKCKKEMFLDTALFRTVYPRRRYHSVPDMRYGSTGSTQGDWEPSPFLPSLGRYSR